MYVDRCTTWSELISKRNTMASFSRIQRCLSQWTHGHLKGKVRPQNHGISGKSKKITDEKYVYPIKSSSNLHQNPMNIPWISHKYPEIQLQWLHINCCTAASSGVSERVQPLRGKRSGTWSPVAIFCNEWCKTPFYYQCYIIIIFMFIQCYVVMLLIHVFPCLSMSFVSVRLSPLGMDGSWAKAPGNTVFQVRKAVSKCSLQSASAGACREAELGRCQNASWRPKIWIWCSINGYYCNLCDKPGSVQPPTLLFRPISGV